MYLCIWPSLMYSYPHTRPVIITSNVSVCIFKLARVWPLLMAILWGNDQATIMCTLLFLYCGQWIRHPKAWIVYLLLNRILSRSNYFSVYVHVLNNMKCPKSLELPPTNNCTFMNMIKVQARAGWSKFCLFEWNFALKWIFFLINWEIFI